MGPAQPHFLAKLARQSPRAFAADVSSWRCYCQSATKNPNAAQSSGAGRDPDRLALSWWQQRLLLGPAHQHHARQRLLLLLMMMLLLWLPRRYRQ
jgi:hypothetical protein